LVLNTSSGFTNPSFGKTPYLAFGSWSNRGASPYLPIGALNPSISSVPSKLKFTQRLWDFVPSVRYYSTQPAVFASYVVMIADWGTSPKAVQLSLFHHNYETSTSSTIGKYNWNWGIEESVYYPGAEFVAIDTEDVNNFCGYSIPRLTTIGQEINYSIDMTALFECMDQNGMFLEPMPSTADIPVTSVSWALEGTGKDGGLWVDVHSMSVVPLGSLLAEDEQAISTAAIPQDGDETAKIRQRLADRCALDSGCTERHQLALDGRAGELELPFEQRPTREDLIDAVRSLGERN
jgi:hypothetical protein